MKNPAVPFFTNNVMFMVGYYNGLKVVRRQIIYPLFAKENCVNYLLFHVINQCPLRWMYYNYSSQFWLYLITTYKYKKKIYCVYVAKEETRQECFLRITRENLLTLYNMSTVTSQIILRHRTVIILKERQTFLQATLKLAVHLLNSLFYNK